MTALLRFLLLASIKAASRLAFRFEVEWVGRRPRSPLAQTRVMILLNHTSLFEPVFLAVLPLPFLWRLARRALMPGADKTLERPLVGRFFKALAPGVVGLTRTRDSSWRHFLARVDEESIVVMAPEGRMKRPGGFDVHGKPMTVRTGIADVLAAKDEGTLFVVYSAGLHHVQAPGQGAPRLFQTVRARLEELPIAAYKRRLRFGEPGFAERVASDLERRRDRHCRWDDVSAAGSRRPSASARPAARAA